MKVYEVSCEMDAPPEAVWAVLSSPARLVEAGTGVTRLEGKLELGERVRVWSEVSPNRAFGVVVSELDAPRRMVWSGGMPLGLFRGVRRFTLERTEAGTRFVMREEFTGLLWKLVVGSMPDLQPSFEKFARALKLAAERGGRR
jgi:hypothetical protein